MHHASTSIICYVHIEQLSILDNLRFFGFELAWRFVTIDWGNEVNSNDVYMMLLALLVPDSTNMDHWINHWLSETVVVCFEVKVITTLLVPGLGMAWRSSPIWVSLGVVAGWDQTSRSCLNKFHTTAIASSFLIAYQNFPHIQQSVSFVFSPYLYICDIYSKGSDAEALSMPTPTGVIAPSLVLGALLMRCFTSLLPERHNCWFIDGCHNQTFKHRRIRRLCRCFVPLLGSDSSSDACTLSTMNPTS